MEKGLIGKVIAKSAVVGVLAGALYFVGASTLNRLDEQYFSTEYFDNVEWCKKDNSSGRIWNEYKKNKEIPHNQIRWQEYQEKVNEKNHGDLEGWMYIPCSENKN